MGVVTMTKKQMEYLGYTYNKKIADYVHEDEKRASIALEHAKKMTLRKYIELVRDSSYISGRFDAQADIKDAIGLFPGTHFPKRY